ncbi:MAG: type II toxin-antitoxin system RelE/ParE family toxin [Rhodospirillaceae bacterium]
MIKSFRDKTTKALFDGDPVRRFAGIAKIAQRKLDMLDAARALEDLRVPPGNHLERLKGDRAGQCSIRVNDQWRLCFVWTEDGPEDVEMVDYHQ